MLSDRQREILAFINQHRAVEQYNPTQHEISERFGWKSANAAFEHLLALERKGVIERRPSGRYVVQGQFIVVGVVV